MIKAVIFDMDGVLIASEPLWEKSTKEYFQKLGKVFPSDRHFKQFINIHFRGRNQRYIIGILKKRFNLRDSYQKILYDRLRILFRIFDRELKLMPGALPLVKTLHRHNYPLVLASSSPREAIQYVMKRYHLKKYFRSVISGDDFRHSKPHPEIFLKGAKLLKEAPKNIVVIEDSISGVLAAHRAGMKCIALKQPYTDKKYLKTADVIVSSLKKINLGKI